MTHLFNVSFDAADLYGAEGIDFAIVNGGTIEISAGAAVVGSYGCSLSPLNGYKTAIAMRTNNLAHFCEAFDFDPNSISIPTTKYIYLARNYHLDASLKVYALLLRYTDPNWQIQSISYHDDGGSSTGVAHNITDAKHVLETRWQAASAVGANDGYFRLLIDGVLLDDLASQDNDTLRVNWPSLGTGTAPTDAISGSLYVTNWVANDDGTELTHPWIVSATISNTIPDRLVVVFSEVVTAASFTAGLVVEIGGVPVSVTAALQADNKTLWLTMDVEAANGDTVTLSYDKATGSITDAAGNILPPYTDYAVTNNVLPPAAPGIASIEVGTVAENTVVVEFDELVHSTDFKAGVTIGGVYGSPTISSATLQVDGYTVYYVLSGVVIPSDSPTWSYDPATGEILDADDGEMDAVTNAGITNNTAAHYDYWIDFKTGDTTQFSSVTDPDGDLTVDGTSAMGGMTNGLSVMIDDTAAANGNKTLSPQGAAGDSVHRLYLDPNTLTMANGNEFVCFRVYNRSAGALIVLYLNYATGTGYRLMQITYNDASTNSIGAYVNLTDEAHCIDFVLLRAATDVSADGSLEMLVDGVSKQTLSNIDNYDRMSGVGSIQVGAIAAVDAGTSGTFYVAKLAGRAGSTAIGA